MKVVALLETAITSGGGFNQALSAVAQMSRIAKGNFEFSVLTSLPANIPLLAALGIPATEFKPTLADRAIAWLTGINAFLPIQSRLRLLGPLEKYLISIGCELVYFVGPPSRPAPLQILNYIATVWDNCHRDNPEFPEVRSYGEFHRREYNYKTCLPPAYIVLVDSELLKNRIHNRYGIDNERMIVMPFSPSPTLSQAISLSENEVLCYYGLEPGFIFYPAQFWAHKNHARILDALALLRGRGQFIRAVFVGGDQGNAGHINRMIELLGLGDQVSNLGFVPTEHLRGLYQGCSAVVMPTYFGPTNLPPIEAWELGKPLVYSRHLNEQVGDAALLVDPDDAESIAHALLSLQNHELSLSIAGKGMKRLNELANERTRAEHDLLNAVTRLASRTRSWK